MAHCCCNLNSVTVAALPYRHQGLIRTASTRVGVPSSEVDGNLLAITRYLLPRRGVAASAGLGALQVLGSVLAACPRPEMLGMRV
jgi:hypothetical protein